MEVLLLLLLLLQNVCNYTGSKRNEKKISDNTHEISTKNELCNQNKINEVWIIYRHFHRAFPLNRKKPMRPFGHPLHSCWHPVRLCNDHVELRSVHRCLKNSIRIRHLVDRHSRDTVSILIHPEKHLLRWLMIQRTRANLFRFKCFKREKSIITI